MGFEPTRTMSASLAGMHGDCLAAKTLVPYRVRRPGLIVYMLVLVRTILLLSESA